MGSNVVGASEVEKEEPRQRQYVSDICIGVIFGGMDLGRNHRNDKVSGFDYIKPIGVCREGPDDLYMKYALFVEEAMKGTDDAYKIYVGGCGTQLFSRYGFKNRHIESVVGGDVLELLSRAVISVTDYINSLSDVSPDSTNLHFYVFGFSYGAACARIFCHLLLRGRGGELKYEQDFSKYQAKRLLVNGSLKFLDKYQDKQKMIEVVGLYDTEQSVGFLTMRDGTIRMCKS